ncbi:MAG: hypothetical protein IPJ52_10235 [Rhodocyclaceae bacterium]|nr:hypothetical protein [Rhodocyclaceae bacterium]
MGCRHGAINALQRDQRRVGRQGDRHIDLLPVGKLKPAILADAKSQTPGRHVEAGVPAGKSAQLPACPSRLSEQVVERAEN